MSTKPTFRWLDEKGKDPYDWNTGCWNYRKSSHCNGYRKQSGEVKQSAIDKGKGRVVGTNERFGARCSEI